MSLKSPLDGTKRKRREAAVSSNCQKVIQMLFVIAVREKLKRDMEKFLIWKGKPVSEVNVNNTAQPFTKKRNALVDL